MKKADAQLFEILIQMDKELSFIEGCGYDVGCPQIRAYIDSRLRYRVLAQKRTFGFMAIIRGVGKDLRALGREVVREFDELAKASYGSDYGRILNEGLRNPIFSRVSALEPPPEEPYDGLVGFFNSRMDLRRILKRISELERFTEGGIKQNEYCGRRFIEDVIETTGPLLADIRAHLNDSKYGPDECIAGSGAVIEAFLEGADARIDSIREHDSVISYVDEITSRMRILAGYLSADVPVNQDKALSDYSECQGLVREAESFFNGVKEPLENIHSEAPRLVSAFRSEYGDFAARVSRHNDILVLVEEIEYISREEVDVFPPGEFVDLVSIADATERAHRINDRRDILLRDIVSDLGGITSKCQLLLDFDCGKFDLMKARAAEHNYYISAADAVRGALRDSEVLFAIGLPVDIEAAGALEAKASDILEDVDRHVLSGVYTPNLAVPDFMERRKDLEAVSRTSTLRASYRNRVLSAVESVKGIVGELEEVITEGRKADVERATSLSERLSEVKAETESLLDDSTFTPDLEYEGASQLFGGYHLPYASIVEDAKRHNATLEVAVPCRRYIGIMNRYFGGRKFIEPTDAEELRREMEAFSAILMGRLSYVTAKVHSADTGAVEYVLEFVQVSGSFLAGLMSRVHEYNLDLALKKAPGVSRVIGEIGGHKLDSQQCAAIAMDVSTRLVMAGAGTGKTTTALGLLKYLIATGIDPDKILLLTYSRAAALEIGEKALAETGYEIKSATFHSYGLSIVSRLRGRSTSPNSDISAIVRGYFSGSYMSPAIADALVRYIAFGDREISCDRAFESTAYLDEDAFVSMKDNRRMKSKGEVDIANYLYINGIDYEPEHLYPNSDCDDPELNFDFRPDFFITQKDPEGREIYIEYYGIDKEGHTRPDIPEKEYLAKIKSKRKVHEHFGSRLIELYAYEYWDGVLLDKLERELEACGVKKRPPDSIKIFEDHLKNRSSDLNSLVETVSTSIALLKETGKDFDEAYPVSDNRLHQMALSRMKDIIKPAYEHYQKVLGGELDFSDMIVQATRALDNGEYTCPYDYVIVDEYQDISRSRFELLAAMRRSNNFRLFCVGDDWQSIYGFNGSIVDYILDFGKYWGPYERLYIEMTYRFFEPALSSTSRFIMLNGRQIKKDLKCGKGRTELHLIDGTDWNAINTVAETVEKILDSDPEARILFLGRRNGDCDALSRSGHFIVSAAQEKDKRRKVVLRGNKRPMWFRTVHAAKGLQADYVFVLNIKKGIFPSYLSDSIVIQYLTGQFDEDFEGERRLMYVALTRGIKATYMVTASGKESEFVDEIWNMFTCPECGRRLKVRKNGKTGERFIGCTGYPDCRYSRDYDGIDGPYLRTRDSDNSRESTYDSRYPFYLF